MSIIDEINVAYEKLDNEVEMKDQLRAGIESILDKATEAAQAGDQQTAVNNLTKANHYIDTKGGPDTKDDSTKPIRGAATNDIFVNKYSDGKGGVNVQKIQKHMQDKINTNLGSLAGAKAHHNIGLSGMDQISYKNELKTYIYFKNTIDKALAGMGGKKDIRVLKIIMNVIDTMVNRTRDDFFRRTKQAASTGKWDSKAANNIRLFQSLSALIAAPTVEKAAEDLFVIFDDLTNETKQVIGQQPSGPSAEVQDLSGVTDEESANSWLAAHGMDVDQMEAPQGNEVEIDPDLEAPIAEEDFGSKIRGIFNEKYEATYKKALNESLEK